MARKLDRYVVRFEVPHYGQPAIIAVEARVHAEKIQRVAIKYGNFKRNWSGKGTKVIGEGSFSALSSTVEVTVTAEHQGGNGSWYENKYRRVDFPALMPRSPASIEIRTDKGGRADYNDLVVTLRWTG